MSDTFREDEHQHRVLDDHLDTIHTLHSGVDPALDVVWDDAEHVSPLELQKQLDRLVQDVIDKVYPVITEAWSRISAAALEAITFLSDLHDCQARPSLSEPPSAPLRIDRRKVSHTSPRPSKPITVYRRGTP